MGVARESVWWEWHVRVSGGSGVSMSGGSVSWE